MLFVSVEIIPNYNLKGKQIICYQCYFVHPKVILSICSLFALYLFSITKTPKAKHNLSAFRLFLLQIVKNKQLPLPTLNFRTRINFINIWLLIVNDYTERSR
jgi:hypothetical protein